MTDRDMKPENVIQGDVWIHIETGRLVQVVDTGTGSALCTDAVTKERGFYLRPLEAFVLLYRGGKPVFPETLRRVTTSDPMLEAKHAAEKRIRDDFDRSWGLFNKCPDCGARCFSPVCRCGGIVQAHGYKPPPSPVVPVAEALSRSARSVGQSSAQPLKRSGSQPGACSSTGSAEGLPPWKPAEPVTIRQLTGVAVFCDHPNCIEEEPCPLHRSTEDADRMRRAAAKNPMDKSAERQEVARLAILERCRGLLDTGYAMGEVAWALARVARDWGKSARGE